MVNTHSDVGMTRHRRAIGTFPNRRAAEHALNELRDSGFPMDRVSIITQDSDKGDIAGATHDTKTDEGAKTGAAAGGALGTLTGLLVGLGTLAIPGIGPIMLAGTVATTLATTLAGTAIGAVAGGLLGALVGLGIPEEDARGYHDRIMRGEYMVIVDGSDSEIAQAERILHDRGIEAYNVYDAPEATAAAVPAANPMPLHSAHPDPRVPQGNDMMDVGRHQHAIARFSTLHDAEAAVSELKREGFPSSQISVIAKRMTRRESFTGLDISDRFERDRYGIPANQAEQYDNYLERGDFLVIVSGNDADIRRAHDILSSRHTASWDVFGGTADMTNLNRDAMSQSGIASSGSAFRQHNRRAIGVFSHRRDTEAALSELRDAGFSMDQISILSKDSSQGSQVAGVDVQQRTGNKADEGAKTGAATGAALGGLGGLLVGLGTLAIPGLGPVMLGGAAATAIATTLSGGALGAAAGGLAGALVGLGIPENRARVYNDRFNRGDDLVMIDGSDDDLHRAESILKRHQIQEWDMFDSKDVHENQSTHSSVSPSGTMVDRTSERRYERLGIDESARTGMDVDRENISDPNAKKVSQNPEVIIIDHRNDPH